MEQLGASFYLTRGTKITSTGIRPCSFGNTQIRIRYNDVVRNAPTEKMFQLDVGSDVLRTNFFPTPEEPVQVVAMSGILEAFWT